MPQETEATKTNIKYAGDVIVKGISIESFGSSEESQFDISALVREFNIYENIFENCLSADLIIADGLDLVNKFPLIGQEIVKITFGLLVESDFDITQQFYVYRVSDRYADETDQVQVYKLSCCSVPFMRNSLNTIQKSFSGAHMDIVADIYEEYLYSSLFPKPLKYNLTLLEETFVAPNWSALRCINYIAERAQRKDNAEDCTYLFWEGMKQFNFRTLASLYEQEPVLTLSRFNANEYDPQTKEKNAGLPFFTIESMTLNESHNRLSQIRNGTLSSKLQTYDPITRTFKTNEYSYKREFNNTSHLNKYPFLPFKSDLFSDKYNSNIQYHPLATFRNDDKQEDFVTENALRRNAKISELTNFSAFCTVPGNTILKAGDVVNVLYKQKSSTFDGSKPFDEYLNGKWLIGSIRHSVTTNSDYRMFLTLYKESVEEPYPDANTIA